MPTAANGAALALGRESTQETSPQAKSRTDCAPKALSTGHSQQGTGRNGAGRPSSHPVTSQRARRKCLQVFLLLSVPTYSSLNMPSSTPPTLFTPHRWQSTATWHGKQCQGQASPKFHSQQQSQTTSRQVFSLVKKKIQTNNKQRPLPKPKAYPQFVLGTTDVKPSRQDSWGGRSCTGKRRAQAALSVSKGRWEVVALVRLPSPPVHRTPHPTHNIAEDGSEMHNVLLRAAKER